MGEPVILVPYDPAWGKWFSEVHARLRHELSEVAVRIDHIGSTAIPGLAAKPVLDVQISVHSFEPLNSFRVPLENLGFVFRPDNPDRTKRYFRERPGERRTHIHVRRAGSWSEQFSLLFRDYLRQNEEDRAAYEAVKRELAIAYGTDRERYTASKSPTIWRIMERASQWSQDTGWA